MTSLYSKTYSTKLLKVKKKTQNPDYIRCRFMCGEQEEKSEKDRMLRGQIGGCGSHKCV